MLVTPIDTILVWLQLSKGYNSVANLRSKHHPGEYEIAREEEGKESEIQMLKAVWNGRYERTPKKEGRDGCRCDPDIVAQLAIIGHLDTKKLV